ncbi:hypothetical protein [Staphylococcus epidermidis]|uniref:hypothetical protein n=1 Tax=Staphylococcus epidermidis TaxID=1282 RepID=UPI001932E518|nr:hypothetical protein [Staphylococcus epidermidis]MBM0775520.1 hypothetical protein [Staphylococcus epidermidis]
MGKNSFRWQENPDINENLNTIIGKLLSNSEMSFNLDETKSPYYENINITKVYDKNQNYTIKEENINYNVFSYHFDKIDIKNENSLLNEDTRSENNGFIIIYEKDNKVNYIIDKYSGSLSILRNYLNYTGKEEIIDNKINVTSDFIIWLINKVYNGSNSYEPDGDETNENQISIDSVIGFKGDTDDNISKLTADGDTVMKLMSSLTFLLESKNMVFIKLKIKTLNHRSIVFKLHLNGSVNIEINNYKGKFRNEYDDERIVFNLFLLIYLEILPILNTWYNEEKNNMQWNDDKYDEFLSTLSDDIIERIDSARSPN